MEALSVFLLCALTVCIAIVVAAAARIRTKRQSWESDLVSTFVIFGSGVCKEYSDVYIHLDWDLCRRSYWRNVTIDKRAGHE